MSRNYNERPNGYLETIRIGLDVVRGFRDGLSIGIGTRTEQIERLKTELKTADAIVIELEPDRPPGRLCLQR